MNENYIDQKKETKNTTKLLKLEVKLKGKKKTIQKYFKKL